MLEQGAAQPEWHSAMRIKACTRDGFFWIINRWFRQEHGDCKFHGNLTAHAMEAKRRKSRFVSLSLHISVSVSLFVSASVTRLCLCPW